MSPGEAFKLAESLGILNAVHRAVIAIVSGKPTVAERLAKNAALAAGAKLAARGRIKATK